MRGVRALRRAIALACALPLACVSLDVERRDWLEVEGGSFRLISEVGRDETLRLYADLDGFRQVASAVLGVRPPAPRAPIQVFALSPASYRAFGPPGTAGFFSATPRGVFIALDAQARIAARGIIYHEYTHYMLSESSAASHPRWYDEGLAEFLRGTEIDGDQAVVGLALEDRLLEVRRNGRGTIGSVVLPYATQFSSGLAFYATSWLLVHYLQLGFSQGLPDRREQLRECLSLLDRGVPAEEAFQTAFGVSVAELDAELVTYLQRTAQSGHLTAVRKRIPAGERVEPGIRALPTAEALAALGTLAHHTRTSDRAPAMYAKALRYAPDDPRLLASLARSLPRSDTERRRALVGQALEAGAQDPQVHVDAGFVWLSEIVDEYGERDPKGAQGDDYARAYREARTEFERSLALCKLDCAEAEVGLGSLLLLPSGDPSLARQHLEVAADELPGHFPTQFALASAYLRSGSPEQARRILQRQLQNAHETRWMPRIARRIAEADAAVQAK